MAHFELWLLQEELQALTAEAATAAKLTDCMVMLQSVIIKAAALAMAGHDVAVMEAACGAARQHLQEAATERALQAAHKFKLPADALSAAASSSSSSSSGAGTWRLPEGMLPAAAAPEGAAFGLDTAKQAAAAALGSLPVGPSSGTLGQQLQQLLQQAAALTSKISSCDTAALLLLSSIEGVLFNSAAAGFGQANCRLESEAEVQLLQQVVDAYRAALMAFKATPAAAALMQVQLRSAEVLVVWVAYCMTDDAARRLLPVVASYGVGLCWEDLWQVRGNASQDTQYTAVLWDGKRSFFIPRSWQPQLCYAVAAFCSVVHRLVSRHSCDM
jgi:hypothetical protein